MRAARVCFLQSVKMGWYDWHVGTGLRDLLLIANPKDRAVIFSLVAEKLEQEHTLGGGKGYGRAC